MPETPHSKITEKVREFNRFYLPAMGLLGIHYLGSEYSSTEARVLYEIHECEGCNAAHITAAMNIDKSYLSKILSCHEKNGYLKKSPPLKIEGHTIYILQRKGKRGQKHLYSNPTTKSAAF